MSLVPWKYLDVELQVLNQIIGGIPTDLDLIKGWIEANMKNASDEERKKIVEETGKMFSDPLDPEARNPEKMWTTFKKDDVGIYLEDRCIKAMLKESANILRDSLQKTEVKPKKKSAKSGEDTEKLVTKSRYTNLKAKFAERAFVKGIEHPNKIRLTRDGKIIVKPDGTDERPIHVMTAQGPRTALKRFDFVKAGAHFKFRVKYLEDGVVDADLVAALLEFGGENGLGADRSQENGKFAVISVTEKTDLKEEAA